MFRIPKLTRSDYNTRKARLKSEFEYLDSVTGYVDTVCSTLAQAGTRCRVKNNPTALALIMRNASDDLINDITKIESSGVGWKKLHKRP